MVLTADPDLAFAVLVPGLSQYFGVFLLLVSLLTAVLLSSPSLVELEARALFLLVLLFVLKPRRPAHAGEIPTCAFLRCNLEHIDEAALVRTDILLAACPPMLVARLSFELALPRLVVDLTSSLRAERGLAAAHLSIRSSSEAD